MTTLLRSLAIALLLSCVLPGTAQAARSANEPAPAITVVIDDLTPAVPTADGTLTIHGRVISSARTTLTDVSVLLRRSSSPLSTRNDVDAIASSPLNPEGGDPDDVSLPGTRQDVADSLPPGGRGSFTIKVPFADLGLAGDGTYVIAIEALARDPSTDGSAVRKGVLRTFLPWFPDPGAVRPVSLVWLWPLADGPARDASGLLLDNTTPTEISDGGRLDRLLAIGSRFSRTVSWVADPALLETVSDMAGGYQVLIDGQVSIGDREADAKRWLTGLGAATAGQTLRTVPYADVDASAVVRASMSNDVVRAVTTGPTVAARAVGRPTPGGMYWAPFGRIDRNTANLLASAGVTSIILSADALPPTDGSQITSGEASTSLPTSFGAIRAVLTDPGLTADLGAPQRSASEVIAARQRFLAETALISTTLPDGQTARTVVVAPPSLRWDPTSSLIAPLLRATRVAPWLRSASLDDVLNAPASTTSRDRSGYGPKARDAELSPTYMESIARVTTRLNSFTSVIDDPTGISEPYSAAILRAESAAWRSDQTRGRELVGSISAQLAKDVGQVRVLSEGNITFSGDNGRVPVTIENDLDRSITIGLALVGRPPLRLESEPLSNIRIDAGRMASVDIDARVVGGDPLTVEVQLLDADQRPYGRPALITLSSTAYARAAAWVVALAFLAIVVFVVVGVTRRIHKAQTSSRQDSGPT